MVPNHGGGTETQLTQCDRFLGATVRRSYHVSRRPGHSIEEHIKLRQGETRPQPLPNLQHEGRPQITVQRRGRRGNRKGAHHRRRSRRSAQNALHAVLRTDPALRHFSFALALTRLTGVRTGTRTIAHPPAHADGPRLYQPKVILVRSQYVYGCHAICEVKHDVLIEHKAGPVSQRARPNPPTFSNGFFVGGGGYSKAYIQTTTGSQSISPLSII